MGGEMQGVRFAKSADGTALAWRRSGDGPPLVKAATWLTHLDYDRTSPIWSHQTAFHETHFDYLRYDERGCGLSDRRVGTLGLEIWVADLRAVVEAAGMPRPFTLLAQSQGAATAAAYAATYPEDVAQLIICGGFTRGADHRGDPKKAALNRAVIEVLRQGFDEEIPAFRDLFAARFVPDGDPKRTTWLGDLCRKSTTPEAAAALLTARAEIDASPYLSQLTLPTVVFHAEGDAQVPLSEGHFTARNIAGAEFIALPSDNHILQEEEPAWQVYKRELLARTGQDEPQATLTPREEAILALMCEAKSNKAIARVLDVSEKTVRNHATHIFAKLGVTSRAAAIVKAGRR